MTKNFNKAIICLLACLALPACISTMRGTPDRPFKPNVVIKKDLIEAAVTALSNGSLDGTSNTTTRNKQISILLSAVDANYFEFRKDVYANSRHSSASSGALTLLMTIAGGLTPSAGVKNNYLLGTNLVTGFSTQYQKSYLYEKNIASLIATMDSDRDEQLDKILRQLDNGNYRGQSALLDIYKYFVKGTLENAVTTLERDASEKAKRSALILQNRDLSDQIRSDAMQDARDKAKIP